MHHILKYIQVCIPWGESLKKFLKKVLIKFVLYRVIKQKVSTLYVCETVRRRWPFFASIVYTSKTYFYNLWSLHLGRKINKFRKRKKKRSFVTDIFYSLKLKPHCQFHRVTKKTMFGFILCYPMMIEELITYFLWLICNYFSKIPRVYIS